MPYLLLAGAVGGLVRGLVGFTKHQFAYKNVKFEPWYFTTMMLISAFIGLACSWAIANSGIKFTYFDDINPAISFIIGYAGGDLLENLYKIIIGKDSLYSVSKKK
jgi:hypothetical protein